MVFYMDDMVEVDAEDIVEGTDEGDIVEEEDMEEDIRMITSLYLIAILYFYLKKY
jgi:hypothetical protein